MQKIPIIAPFFNPKAMEGSKSEIEDISNEEIDTSNSFKIDFKMPVGKDKVAECYLKEMKKIEIWTYLFRQLTNASDLLFGMCEIERKTEFCKGVIDCLSVVQEEFIKLEKRLQIEQMQQVNLEPKVWDYPKSDKVGILEEVLKERDMVVGEGNREMFKGKLRGNMSPNNSMEKNSEFIEEKKEEFNPEKYEDVFDEEGLVEFQLLLELMNEGKYSFYESVVLLIRERATLMSETTAGQIKDKKTFRKNSEDLFLEERAISTPLNVKRLFNRIHRKILYEKSEAGKEGSFDKDKMAQKYNEKLQQAENRRMKLNEQKSEAISRTINRVEEVKLKQNDLVNKRQETMDKKEHSYYQRKLVKLAVLKQKAKENKMKASEISFLQLLEKNAKKRHIDTKLEETRKRRLAIIQSITERNKKADNLIFCAKTRKEKIDNDKKTQLLKRLNKIDEAQKRRQQILDEKVKKTTKTVEEIGSSHVQENRNVVEEEKVRLTTIYLLEEKEKLDKIFKNAKLFDKKMIGGRAEDLYRSYSDEILPTYFLNPKLLSDSFEFEPKNPEKAPKKKKKKNKKNASKVNSENESLLDLKNADSEKSKKTKMLKAFYRFLTKDTESLNKIRILKMKNLSLRQTRNSASMDFLDMNNDISEFPELLCRELEAVKDGKDKQPEKCFCTLCDSILKEGETVEAHLNSKTHKKYKLYYGLTFSEDTNSVVFVAERNLSLERLHFLKNKCKKIKQQLSNKAFGNESFCSGKETHTSINKPRLQKLTLEFEKALQSPVKDHEVIRVILQDVSKILEKNVESDFHILRQIRFMSLFIELLKGVLTSPKINSLKLIEIFNDHFKTISKLVLVKENRIYLLLTNRVIPIVDFLIWSWNLSTKFIQCLQYIPQLLQTITLILKSKLPKEKQIYKSLLIEYLVFSGFILKVKAKLGNLNFGIGNDDGNSKVQNIVGKVLQLMETLTSLLEGRNGQQAVGTSGFCQSVYFVLAESDMAGCIQLLASLLLSKGQYNKSSKTVSKNLLNQSILVLKILNNFARGDLRMLQKMLGGNSFNADQFYHIQAFLYDFCTANYKNDSEIFEVLQELLFLTGYFCLRNSENQSLVSRGTENHTIVYKLANLPYQFYFGEAQFKDLVFPTLISTIYKNERNLSILLSEVNKNILLDYLRAKIEIYKNVISDKNPEENVFFCPSSVPDEKMSLSSKSNAFTNPQKSMYPLHARFPVEYLPDLEEFMRKFEI